MSRSRRSILVCEDRRIDGDGPMRRLVVVPNEKRCGVPTVHEPAGLLPQGDDGARVELWACTRCGNKRPWGCIGGFEQNLNRAEATACP